MPTRCKFSIFSTSPTLDLTGHDTNNIVFFAQFGYGPERFWNDHQCRVRSAVQVDIDLGPCCYGQDQKRNRNLLQANELGDKGSTELKKELEQAKKQLEVTQSGSFPLLSGFRHFACHTGVCGWLTNSHIPEQNFAELTAATKNLAAMKKQAEATNTEYDRLTKEYSQLQVCQLFQIVRH